MSVAAAVALALTLSAGVTAQAPQGGGKPEPFSVGNALGLPIAPAADGTFNAMSKNVKVYGAIYSAESCSYDPTRDLIVVPNRGVGQNVQTNNAWVSFINHDGSVHTARWIGLQNPGPAARQPDPEAGAERAAWQRHRERRAVPGGPRRRHHADRSPGIGRAQVQHEDRRAGG